MSMTAQKATDSDADDQPKRRFGGLRRKIVIGVVALAVVCAATWWFVLRGGAPAEPEAGEISTLEPIQINLASNHYLRLGLALQLTKDAGEVDGSRALDAAIDMFSGRNMNVLAQTVKRDQLKAELTKILDERYDGGVMGVYFTEFVTQ